MTFLILGLALFLGIHSVRIVSDDARTRFIATKGKGPWKGLYSVASAVGLALIIWGYGAARSQPVVLWEPTLAMKPVAVGLMLLAFILIIAAYVPGNAVKASLHHPMVLSVMAWAVAHLLVKSTLASLLLFGSFGVWAALSFLAARKRDKAGGVVYARGRLVPTLITLVAGAATWAAFSRWGHGAWLGVQPLS